MKPEEAVEFAINSESRCPCVLLLDTSGSMSGQPITSLNLGLQTFKDNLIKDRLASLRVEVAIITFDKSVKVLQDFVTAAQFNPPVIEELGSATNMCAGINMALDLVESRKTVYRTNGVTYYRPWIFMITDGAPTESDDEINRASQRIKDEEAKKRMSFFAVGVEDADMEKLKFLSVREPVKLNGLNFSELFKWLSASMQRVSSGKTDEQAPLPPLGWATSG